MSEVLSDSARRRHERESVILDLEGLLADPPTVSVGLVDAVEFRRDQYGLRAIDWARLLGVAKSHYSEFVAGKRGLPYRVLRKLYVLGVPADVILLEVRRTG